jgi:hypothetical protein
MFGIRMSPAAARGRASARPLARHVSDPYCVRIGLRHQRREGIGCRQRGGLAAADGVALSQSACSSPSASPEEAGVRFLPWLRAKMSVTRSFWKVWRR